MPAVIMAAAAVGVMLYLFFVFGYSTGYGFQRATLWSSMVQGYGQEGGEWSFGYFVVPAVVVLLWVTRDRYAGMHPQPSWWGLVIVVFALFVYFGGYKANEKYVGYAAGQLLVAGFILWFLGWRFFRKAFWLLVLFGLTWPLVFLAHDATFPLRKLMTGLTVAFLKVIGEDLVRDGMRIMSAPTPELEAGERFSLGIAAACSGLRSLFALAMVSLLYGYLSLKKGWQRLALLVSAIPLAILGNFTRMVLLYFGTIWFGSEIAIGEGEHDPSAYHIGAGLAVFVVALFGMMALVKLLNGGFKVLRTPRSRVRRVDSGENDASFSNAP